eukprot:1161568-Pelagomonas_calceolata.AAC.14
MASPLMEASGMHVAPDVVDDCAIPCATVRIFACIKQAACQVSWYSLARCGAQRRGFAPSHLTPSSTYSAAVASWTAACRLLLAGQAAGRLHPTAARVMALTNAWTAACKLLLAGQAAGRLHPTAAHIMALTNAWTAACKLLLADQALFFLLSREASLSLPSSDHRRCACPMIRKWHHGGLQAAIQLRPTLHLLRSQQATSFSSHIPYLSLDERGCERRCNAWAAQRKHTASTLLAFAATYI